MSTSFIRFLDELEHHKSFLFLKNEKKKIEDCPLENQADGQPNPVKGILKCFIIFLIAFWGSFANYVTL